MRPYAIMCVFVKYKDIDIRLVAHDIDAVIVVSVQPVANWIVAVDEYLGRSTVKPCSVRSVSGISKLNTCGNSIR